MYLILKKKIQVLGVTAKSKESNNGRLDPVVEMTADPVMDPEVEMTADPVMDPGVAMTVDPVEEMIVDPEGVMIVDPVMDPGVGMTVDPPEGVMVVVEAGVMLPVRIAVLNAEMIAGNLFLVLFLLKRLLNLNF
jgi:hypothetical protein